MGAIYNSITALNEYMSIAFNEAYTMPPTTQGTRSTLTAGNFTNDATAPVFESSNGPFPGDGSWRFKSISGYGNTRIKNQVTSGSNSLHDLIATDNHTVGFWLKINSVNNSTNTASNVMIQRALATTGTSTSQYGITAGTLGDPSNPTYAAIGLANQPNGTQVIYTDENGNQIVNDKWYFVALRTTLSGGTRTQKLFINGAEKIFYTNTGFTSGYINSVYWGFVSGGAAFADVNIANWFIADAANITEADIQNIYAAAGQSINNATAITASALMTEPTIAVQTGDHVEITTSITASAIFPDSTVEATKFVNNIITELLEASATIGDNISINSGVDIFNSVLSMDANITIIEPTLPPPPMTANATFVDPTITIPQNYFNYVMQNNPLIYFNTFPTGNSTAFPNYGSLNLGVIDKGPVGSNAGTLNQQASGVPLSYIGDGFSLGSSGSGDQFNYFDKSGYATQLANVYITKNWTHEFWYKPTSGSSYNYTDDVFNMTISHTSSSVTANIIFRTTNGTIFESTITNASSFLTNGQWHNVALIASSWSSTEIRLDLYVNSVFLGLSIQTFNTNVTDIYNHLNAGSNEMTWTLGMGSAGGALFDEIAVYPSSLSSQTLATKYNFIDNLSPDNNYNAGIFQTNALMPNANFVVAANINNQETPATASLLFIEPTITPGVSINIIIDSMLASATNTDATAYWGRTYFATPMISSAESKEGFVLNDIYYNYVQTNIAPYRYVSFDAADALFDYGIDNDYSVIPTIVGGTIVNPDLGINGKSAKTAGTSYITDGVILKESEWDDSWGTGANSYHSAFWFQRALDDTSTTGLRVLWNLNGYKDNQHVVLYQYQNKLHMQFNNGSGSWIGQVTTNTIDLFDYNRHFIVIEFDHTNPVNNAVKLYVDAVLEMTVNLGSYTGETTNASSADSGPNDEANNHPRLSIGCLITPFAATSLPVVPTNTKLIIDEIYWDKNSISSTIVTNLFNIMPDKDNLTFNASAITASIEIIMPMISTAVNFLADPFTASVELLQPLITADREVIYTANAMTATGLMANAEVNENRTISADFMQAVATFNDPGVQITIPGGPMLAEAFFPKNIKFNSLPLTDMPAYIRYLRILNTTTKQHPMKEVV